MSKNPSFSNARPLSWSRLEQVLSGRHAGSLTAVGMGEGQRVSHFPAGTQGQDASPQQRHEHIVDFAELHACSSYNFLRGASDPEQMVATAQKLGLTAIACLDRDGLYGASRCALAAAEAGVDTVFGAELSVQWQDCPDTAGSTTDEGTVTVLCKGQEGYRRLSHVITDAAMADRDKDVHRYPPRKDIAAAAAGQWYVLIDWRWLPYAAELVEDFGAENCLVELQHTMNPADWDRNEALHGVATRWGLREIVSACATCADPSDARLAGAKAALHRTMDVATALPVTAPTGGRWLRSGQEMLQLAGDCTWLAEAVETSAQVARECAFTLNLIAPNLPHFPVPEGYTEMTWLRHLVETTGAVRYGPRPHSGASTRATAAQTKAWAVIDKELAVIEQLGFPGYFLIVHDIVDFCHRSNILCQGRGSAANSAVCFALGITTVDAVAGGLLFERFLSPERDGPPDIDVDIESGRREEVIQYVYSRYGRDNAAQVANVITYRSKGALRDAARALGYAPGQVDAWSRGVEEPPAVVRHIADQLKGQPRHMGIHSGGMVICDRPIADVVPMEWARMDNRSVVQWDKDDCATVGLVKFDLLGLGMLEALHHAIDQVQEHRGRTVELWRLEPTEPEVYEMLSQGDAVGVFQVESRAQLNTLPRLRPRRFYDLVVQVALIRPGPIQGGSVHPFIRRRNGQEPVTFDHPCLEPALTKTLGIPLFQEQLMQVVVDAAGFSAAEADTLRRAMGSKRSPQKMARLKERFYQGLKEENGIVGEVADRLWDKIVAFASYGFPESHAQSFAVLVYYSAWFKYHYPAEFCVALLRAQPMGFYSPQSLLADARRHGVQVLPVDVNFSGVEADTVVAEADRSGIGAIRLGLASVKGIGVDVAERIVQARSRVGTFRAVSDLSREADLRVDHVEQLARAGALESLGLTRRQAMWAAGVAATERPGMLAGTSHINSPSLPGMSAFELTAADLATTGVTPQGHPVELLRELLDQWAERRGGVRVLPANQLLDAPDGSRIRVAGVVTHRQRPMTAGGVVFFGLEDETGLANVMISPGLWARQRTLALSAKIVVIRGIVHNANGVASVTADLIEPVPLQQQMYQAVGDARNFR
ncbi:error-prone DNA polymerase [Corynebacterium sp. zg254]|uniref:Error-prone DNA polymerase n=1 Tax=Corynebacterium zhongnanshanii TaxID=2768834 RepID=A0ABQ6VGK4_9CORY|nr:MULTISPECIES: error-prone DNA polymerase [Corynebacterium]KAB3522918.1 error-prone DNA polymerase [Corynebacterium zhongnanshanii]MCR5914006.1 error-prone DNA polymerase [Corynebacterium sp. zg254]